MTRHRILFLAVFILYAYIAYAQADTSLIKSITVENINSKILAKLGKQYSSLQSKLNNKSAKLLSNMKRKEDMLHAKLNGIDSSKAKELFTDGVKQKYAALQNNLSSTTEKLNKFPLREYVPGLDSMQTCFGFLMSNPNIPADKLELLQTVTTKLKNLESEFQKANDIQTFVREREASLKDQLMNTGLVKELTGINKEAYYYQTQLTEYKELLNHKEKLKEKILETLRKLPAFQKFWQKNSYLAALFPMPANYGTSQALVGLQTRISIQTLVAQRVGNATTTGVNPQQYFQQSVDAAQSQLNQLKDKLNKFSNGSGGGNMTMPDFKPNNQKTKTFFQRFEYGFNIQSQPGQYYLPATTNLALTLGYKISDTKTLGIGTSYILGWGKGWKYIHFTSEGVGLRSYADIKFPTIAGGKAFGNLWFSGGFEYNYLSSFKSLQELHNNVDVWQRSALAGISKKYKVGKKEGNIQLLYDFLHNRQIPPSTALKFRIGYTF